VYLADEEGSQRPRYHEVEAQLQPAALKSWPAKPGLSAEELRLQSPNSKEIRAKAAKEWKMPSGKPSRPW